MYRPVERPLQGHQVGLQRKVLDGLDGKEEDRDTFYGEDLVVAHCERPHLLIFGPEDVEADALWIEVVRDAHEASDAHEAEKR